MQAIFWVSVGLAFSVYFGYPLFLFIASAFMGRASKKSDFTPFVSILIPAYNEEKSIRAKIENSLSLDYPGDKLEIIVISDGSTDKTEGIVNEYANRGIKLIVRRERKGKMAALNNVVPQARGEIIVFSDANTMYRPDAIRKLTRNFIESNIGCVCGNSVFVTDKSSSVESGFGAYMKYERFIWRKESLLRSLLVVDGAIYAIRKHLFSPINEILADDFVNPLMIGARNYGIVYEPDAIAEEKAVTNIRKEFKRKIRVTSQGYKALMLLWRWILKSRPLRIFQYLLHKILRWLVPFLLITIFVSNCFLLYLTIYKYLFAIQVLFYLTAFAGYILDRMGTKVKIFYIPFYFCLINLASAAGLYQALTGTAKATWEKAETTR